ncbi:tetratricopeptide repeat protein [Leptolyngbya cf. ectocarpi LEGE 11479]|uniref:Tetratricopeptide repeat protein n=1 Tax=Leptolyngbya cf. ectocarpi LEGE 11479 TaxID=1828722 RepID=A0A928X282_LEPEC|nr:tetratricopeptide repeat protein [Leptolyngbya ectocarpi]MBE9066530.1 tetratricopeptide repeat protein [Leptolyngbya cf. ectocarpi LEGE 11479]
MSQSSFFLGRTQEQDQFRRVLGQYVPASLVQKHLPTLSKLVGRAPKLPDEPYIFLFHGPGGMGKTTLTRRLKELAAEEFQGQYQTVLLDWDRQRDLNVELQRGHSSIKPQTVLDVLHKELEQSLNGYAGEFYSQARQEIQDIENKVEKTLAAEPPNTELKEITAQYGGKAIAWILGKATEGVITTDPMGAAVAIKVGATLLSQARQLAAKSLNNQEVKIFQQPPWEKLADGLGKDIAKATQRQPGIVFLDTYEIVDRQICDYVLRKVMQQGGRRTIWAISGRSNLAKSGKRGETFFRGYADDFSEAQIYPRELLQFSFREIQEYFEEKVPEVSLTEDEAESIAEFSLGIPFVVDLAAVMCGKGKPIAEIVAPVPNENGDTNDRDQVIKETCERFLKHCLDTPETLQDRQLTFALAMLRRSQMDLLGAMVDAPTGLKERLKTLQGRYAFLAEDEQRLDEKMSNFMQDYLLQDLQRQDEVVQGLNDSAIAWLELQIEEKQKNLSDTAEWFEDERLAAWMLDLAHHYGWQREDALWEYLVPRFIEAWQYDWAWAWNLLQVAEPFQRLLATKQRKTLSRMEHILETKPDLAKQVSLLENLESWLTKQLLDTAKKHELQAILKLKRGYLCFEQDQYEAALNTCLSIVSSCPAGLRSPLATALRQIAWKFSWKKGTAIPSEQGQLAAKKATELDASEAANWIVLGVAHYGLKQHKKAVETLKKGLELSEEAYAVNWLGLAYQAQERYDEAIASYQKAIALDPDYATAYNNLGTTYSELKQYDDAIASYQKAIALDPDYAKAYSNLGTTYSDLKQYDDAIASYQKAITLDPDDATAYNNLGNTYSDLKQYDDAIASYQKAIALDPDYATAYNNLGNTYDDLKQYDEAIASYQKAIEIDPEYDYAHDRLGWVYLLYDQLDKAQQSFEKAVSLDETDRSYILNLGLVHARKNNLESAHDCWQRGLKLIEGDSLYDKAVIALYVLALGDSEQGITDMQTTIEAGASVAAVENALGDAEILATCPQPPDRINDMITLLRKAITQQST